MSPEFYLFDSQTQHERYHYGLKYTEVHKLGSNLRILDAEITDAFVAAYRGTTFSTPEEAKNVSDRFRENYLNRMIAKG